jgi:hypothetical protein
MTGCVTADDDDDDTVEGCTDDTSPAVDIIQPTNTATFDSGVAVHFLASVVDDVDPAGALEITWYDKLYSEETTFDGVAPDGTGRIEFDSADFEDGIHIIKLEAIDTDGCDGYEEITFSVGV